MESVWFISGNEEFSEKFYLWVVWSSAFQSFVFCVHYLSCKLSKIPLNTLHKRRLGCFVLLLREDFIALAILRLIEEEKAVVEGAGVTAFAAVLAGMLPELQDKK